MEADEETASRSKNLKKVINVAKLASRPTEYRTHNSKGVSGQKKDYYRGSRRPRKRQEVFKKQEIGTQICFWDDNNRLLVGTFASFSGGKYRIETSSEGDSLAYLILEGNKPRVLADCEMDKFVKGDSVIFFWKDDGQVVELAYGKVVDVVENRIHIQPAIRFSDIIVVALPNEVLRNPYTEKDLVEMLGQLPHFPSPDTCTGDAQTVNTMLASLRQDLDTTCEKYKMASDSLNEQNQKIQEKTNSLQQLYSSVMAEMTNFKLKLSLACSTSMTVDDLIENAIKKFDRLQVYERQCLRLKEELWHLTEKHQQQMLREITNLQDMRLVKRNVPLRMDAEKWTVGKESVQKENDNPREISGVEVGSCHRDGMKEGISRRLELESQEPGHRSQVAVHNWLDKLKRVS